MTPGERISVNQIIALMERLESFTATVTITDGDGRAAELLRDAFGAVEGPDGYVRATRGSVTVAARK